MKGSKHRKCLLESSAPAYTVHLHLAPHVHHRVNKLGKKKLAIALVIDGDHLPILHAGDACFLDLPVLSLVVGDDGGQVHCRAGGNVVWGTSVENPMREHHSQSDPVLCMS